MILFSLIFTLSAFGFFALASSMSKHQKQYYTIEKSVKFNRIVASIGWILLIISLFICLITGKPSNAISYWLGVLTLSGLLIAWFTSYYANHWKLLLMILGITCLINTVLLF